MRHTPTGTYRVQVRPAFDLDTTAKLVDYLAALGASHLYAAPLLAATPGSEHGYDVVDPTATNPELGGDAALRRLVDALTRYRMGLVIDIVPNHMGVAVPAANPAWWDVLRHGRDSAYAHWFDIDWSAPRLLLPVLADTPDALADLSIVDSDGAEGQLGYHEHRFPIAPGTGGGSPREVHDRQHYELVSWRRGDAELTYRRFFAVSGLAAVRVEDPLVFEATHGHILRWYHESLLDGIRVDHPDGLADPTGYLRTLRERCPDAWLLVEKILHPGEPLPPDWPVDGTTGYDALREVCGLFVDPAGEAPLTEAHAALRGGAGESWSAATLEGKRLVVRELFGAELARLGRLVAAGPSTLDGDLARAALGELACWFDVYRSYLPLGAQSLDAALGRAGAARPELKAALDALAPRLGDPGDPLAVRFQQFTGAVMAKGVEDTAAYRWTRFVALNEVGGDPGRFGVSVDEFHTCAAARQREWPASMTTLSTHDTKRGEDVRARLAVLAEAPDAWAAALRRWRAAAPALGDPALESLLWQTVAGAWPIEAERLRAYLRKAAREAATSTGWADPDTAFEARLDAVVDAICAESALRADVDAFVTSITGPGWVNALGQKLVQLTMPGVPDVYQGTELWENSLVDPDNRRPVDFAARRAILERLDGGWLPPVDGSGAAKLLVTSRALRLRRDRPECFTGYTPMRAHGPAAAHAVAFDRGGAVSVATRLPLGLERAGGWRGTTLTLPPGSWLDALTGRAIRPSTVEVELAALLRVYPVALLVRWKG